MNLKTKDVALMAVFASMQAVLSTFPFTVTIGITGQITLGVMSGPLIGLLLGPMVGGLAVLIGSSVGVFLNPAGAIFGPLTIIPPFLGTLGTVLVKQRKGYFAGVFLLISLVVFYFHEFAREALAFPWLSIIAMVIAFSPIALKAGSSFKSTKSKKTTLFLGIIVALFVGLMSDHIAGSAIAIWYFSPFLTPEILNSILFIYPIERIFLLALTYVIATPIYYSLRRAGLVTEKSYQQRK